MSEHDDTPDPIDKAYVEAEAMLSDDEERAARRSRVLAAIAREPATPAAAPPTQPRRGPDWRRSGWLAAACVVGVSVILVSQIYQPARFRPQSAATPAAPAEPGAKPSVPRMAPAPAAPAPPPLPPPARPALARARVVAAAPTPPPLAVPAPAPPPPAVAADKAAVDVQVEGRRISRPTASQAIAEAPAAPAPLSRFESAAGLRSDPASRLRAAAAAGLAAEVATLLEQGAPVDAPDAEGDTALIKSTRADQPAVAALLRRHGASLDRRNHAGESARDLATAQDDAQLNRALGLGP